MSSTDGCAGHKDALKRTGRAAQTGVQGTKRGVQSPSWRSERHVGAQIGSDVQPVPTVQEKMVSTLRSEASLEGHVESKFCSEASLEREMESKLRSEGSLEGKVESKLCLETSLEGQVRPMRRPRATKFGPRGVQQAGSSAQEAPSWAQKAYKTHSKSTSKTFAARQGRTSKSDDSTALLVVFRGSRWPWRPLGTAKWSPSCAWRPVWRAIWSPSCAWRPVRSAKWSPSCAWSATWNAK